MSSQSFKGFVEKSELWITGLLFLYFLGIDAPPPLVKVMQAASYGIIILLIMRQWKRFAYFATRDIFLLFLSSIDALN